MKDLKQKIISYLKETRAEVKKVAWPENRYVTAATIIILAIVVTVAAMILVMDWALAKLILFLTKAV
jgi:preprotein translocase subunit SecE